MNNVALGSPSEPNTTEDSKQAEVLPEKKWYRVEFWGDVVVQAESEDEAVDHALAKVQDEPPSHLFWNVDLERACRFCGCTEENACEGGCGWVPGADACDAPACMAKLNAEVKHGL